MPMAEEPVLTHQAPPFPHPSSPAALSPVNYSSTLANERVEVRALIKAIK